MILSNWTAEAIETHLEGAMHLASPLATDAVMTVGEDHVAISYRLNDSNKQIVHHFTTNQYAWKLDEAAELLNKMRLSACV